MVVVANTLRLGEQVRDGWKWMVIARAFPYRQDHAALLIWTPAQWLDTQTSKGQTWWISFSLFLSHRITGSYECKTTILRMTHPLFAVKFCGVKPIEARKSNIYVHASEVKAKGKSLPVSVHVVVS